VTVFFFIFCDFFISLCSNSFSTINKYVYNIQVEPAVANGGDAAAAVDKKSGVKGNYVSIHSSGFRDFLLKPEILRAIGDCGFEHPSEIQHECIPQANDADFLS